MYTLSLLFNGFFILYDYLYIFFMNIWFEDGEFYWSMPHHLHVLWLSHFKGRLDLSNNELMGTLVNEMANRYYLCKLLCTHCLNSLMDFVSCMIICIFLLWIYYLRMESVNWPKYLTTCKFCDSLISKMSWICQITNLRADFPLELETWMNLVSYCVHIVLTL